MGLDFKFQSFRLSEPWQENSAFFVIYILDDKTLK